MPAPILGVSVMVRGDDRVLLVRRARPPLENAWAFPGGKVLPGEHFAAAARREVLEETGVTVGDLRRIDLAEIIERDEHGVLRHHYVVIVFAGTAIATPPVAGDDAAEARWVPLADASRLTLTPDTARILANLAMAP